MYKIETYQEQSFKFYQLTNKEGSSWLTVCPERGGIITGYGVRGEEKLYMDKETLFNLEKNVRGGIPILFPISGQLSGGRYEWEGKSYDMPNHGLARINPWEVIETKTNEEQASITIRFASNEKTKENFPFDFELIFTYTIRDGELIIDQSYRNHSSESMPVHAGFHPYFYANSKTVNIETDATKYLDYNDDSTRPFSGSIDLEDLVESVVLLDANKRTVGIELDQSNQIEMTAGKEFAYTVFWSVKGKPFVCVEPWTAKNEEFNRQEELVMVAPTDSLETFVSIKG